ncbi:protein of unknown function DUF541 [Chroococcus sp. FPU101]|nr:protein of unknown function DUF541 [Chroococcus sp. FPU101]
MKKNLIRQSLALVPTIGLFLNLTMMNPVLAQEKVLQTLTVTGQGVERIPTSLTQVQLGVEVQGKTATEVQQQVAKQTSAVVDFLRSRNVERLQTTGIGLQPNYDFSNNQRRLIGYIGTNTVSFRLKTEQIGTLLDEAVQKGATRIDGVSFTATDDAIAVAQKEALKRATQDAQQQSDAVLRALNLTAKDVVSIQINGANPPQPKFYSEQLSRASADVSTPVVGGEQTVQASVTLQISY